MPFNPLLPVDGSLIVAAELRGQFTGLHDETAAILPEVVSMINDASNALTQDIQAVEAGSSANTNAVQTLSITSGDFNVQTLIDKVNELILAARR